MPIPSDKPTVFVGRFISTPGSTTLSIQQGALVVSREGTIQKVDWEVKDTESALKSFDLKRDDVEIVECQEDGFFFPGFIDTHIHAPQYPNVGLFGKSTLLDWLQTYTFPLESSLGSADSPFYKTHPTPDIPIDPLSRAREVYTRVISRTLANGTTTATYYSTNHVSSTKLLFDLAFQHGQRAFIGRACMDSPVTCPDYYRDPSTEATIAAEHECISHSRQLDPSGSLVAPIITPRFAPSCLPSTLTALGHLAKTEDLRIQTHISENTSEVSLVRELFPDSSSYAEVYDKHSLLTPRTVLAHAVHLTPSERKLISERKSKISHCPASNSALGSGLCPVRTYLEDGITVGLGTDVSGGYSPSILEAVRQACLVSRMVGFTKPQDSSEGKDMAHFNLSVTESLYLATIGGAAVLDLSHKLGIFEVGYTFDVQEIRLPSSSSRIAPAADIGSVQAPFRGTGGNGVDIFGWETWEEKVEKWVWNGDERNVGRVWVGGRCVYES